MENPEGRSAREPEPATGLAGAASSSGKESFGGFLGNPTAKLDDRGRLKMPAEFKAFIDRKYGEGFNAFFVTSQDGETAEIFPLPEWDRQMAKIFTMPKSHPARIKLLARYNLFGGRVDMDPQGRLQFPEELRSAADLTGEVKVSGEGNFLRVTNLEKLRQSVKENPLTTQEIDSLTEFGL